MRFEVAVLFALALVATCVAQNTDGPTTEAQPEPTPPITTTVVPPTENPGLPYGSVCNSLIARCNRHSNTVACVQRRPDPTTTTVSPTSEPEPSTGNPLTSLFLRKAPAPRDVCETGIGAVLGKCQCARNCKQGVYVDDGEFDEARDICVGLVGSTCTLLVPNCTQNGRCNFLQSRCVCNPGFEMNSERRCVPTRN